MPTRFSPKLNLVVAILILLTGILIGGYLVLKSQRGLAGQLSQILAGKSFSTETCQPNPNDANQDSDNDGLKDWQEIQIYKTNSCRQDSDGDGYFDGEEVAAGYDPTKKAPGDELPGSQAKKPRPLPNNLTEALRQKLGRQITGNTIRPLNEKGEILSEEELTSFPGVQQAIQEIIASQTGLFAPDPISDEQIKTLPDNSRLAIERYAAAATDAFSFALPNNLSVSQSESEMFLKAMEENDFAELEFHLQKYQGIYQKLQALAVPSDLVPLHKKQLNIISSLIKIYQAIKEINTDPLKANLALQSYQTALEELKNWLEELAEFIKKHPN